MLLLVIGGQWVTRWLPTRLGSQGLAVCLSHRTLHHGVVWLPSEPGFDKLFKAVAGIGAFYEFYFGMFALAFYLSQKKARRVAKLLTRLFPDQAEAAPPSSVNH